MEHIERIAAYVSAAHAKNVKDELRSRGWLDRQIKVVLMSQQDIEGDVVVDPLTSLKIDAQTAFCVFPLNQKFVAEAAYQDQGKEAIQLEMAGQLVWIRRFLYKCVPDEGKKKPAKEQKLPRVPAIKTTVGSGGLGYNKFHGSWRAVNKTSRRQKGTIPSVSGDNKDEIQEALEAGEPFIIRGLWMGPCVGRWSAKYLHAGTTDKLLSAGVHVCPHRTVDLAGHRLPNSKKNFHFCEMTFAEFIRRCSPDEFQHLPPLPPVVEEGERLYLRSVAGGQDAAKRASHIHETFPELAGDLELPAGTVYPPARYHSSVLRVASGDTELWTHYDVMDNILMQVRAVGIDSSASSQHLVPLPLSAPLPLLSSCPLPLSSLLSSLLVLSLSHPPPSPLY
eukprot:765601-Hanusia_phi.AAC.1